MVTLRWDTASKPPPGKPCMARICSPASLSADSGQPGWKVSRRVHEPDRLTPSQGFLSNRRQRNKHVTPSSAHCVGWQRVTKWGRETSQGQREVEGMFADTFEFVGWSVQASAWFWNRDTGGVSRQAGCSAGEHERPTLREEQAAASSLRVPQAARRSGLALWNEGPRSRAGAEAECGGAYMARSWLWLLLREQMAGGGWKVGGRREGRRWVRRPLILQGKEGAGLGEDGSSGGGEKWSILKRIQKKAINKRGGEQMWNKWQASDEMRGLNPQCVTN